MPQKRKRAGRSSRPAKKMKPETSTDAGNNNDNYNSHDHPILKHYFDEVHTLREYVVSRLSKSRPDLAERIAKFGSHNLPEIGILLDSVTVGVNTDPSPRHTRAQDIAVFSQHLPASTLGSHSDPGAKQQLEVIDFVIWLLFRRRSPGSKPQHLLCYGFERASATGEDGPKYNAGPCIPGIVCQYPNPNVTTLTDSTWCRLLSLLGRGGDLVMIDLLVDCGLFVPAQDGVNDLRQISGIPLSVLPARKPHLKNSLSAAKAVKGTAVRTPSEIRFVRSRMFYAKPSINGKGNVRLGMRHIHVLNRCSDLNSAKETLHVLKYIFPRQFRLHNVFTCTIDHRETTQPFKDYTLREAEIKAILAATQGKRDTNETAAPVRQSVPKRLVGKPLQLVSEIRKRHQRCSYVELLRHYCPVADKVPVAIGASISATAQATPASDVSAFCRAVLKKVIPKDCWGLDALGDVNEQVIMKAADRFVQVRKFESLTLHEVMNGLKVASIPWLHQETQPGVKMCMSDFDKRKELLAEFVYYIFDSFLIPLIRSNFHITESNVHRNRLFYFRHDVWRTISEPAMASLRGTMFEELDMEHARKRLSSRIIGYSHVRLLPKSKGFRPITNLRRRPQYWRNGKRMLGRSINSVMAPVFRVLNYEKSTHPVELRGSLFSVGDIYPKLKGFAAQLREAGLQNEPLFFAKVDVQACFDTVPQKQLIEVVSAMVSAENYHIKQHAQVKPPEIAQLGKNTSGAKAVVKYHAEARPEDQKLYPNPVGPNIKLVNYGRSIEVGPLGQQSYRKNRVLALLKEHVEYNVVKIGKKYYRQKNGIPQGSVLSSLLCNFFYGKLEKEVLQFVGRPDTILLRLIDDFLLITTERQVADEFLQVMHQGISEYGISVRPEKSMVNFECSVNGYPMPRSESPLFPYCGMSIDSSNLNIYKGTEKRASTKVADSLTVEYAALPGRTFRRKALNGLKIQLHGMYFDTSFNALHTVFSNLYTAFHDAALRCFHYSKCLPRSSQLSFEYLRGIVQDLIRLGHTMIKKKRIRKNDAWKEYDCAVRKSQTEWLACEAFNEVFRRRQTAHARLLDWLQSKISTPSQAASLCGKWC